MIPHFTSVLAIATNSSHHRGNLSTRAHGSRSIRLLTRRSVRDLDSHALAQVSLRYGGNEFFCDINSSNKSLDAEAFSRHLHSKDRKRCSEKKTKSAS
jgi:hypothetical protein